MVHDARRPAAPAINAVAAISQSGCQAGRSMQRPAFEFDVQPAMQDERDRDADNHAGRDLATARGRRYLASIRPGGAPSAIRMPISRRRRLTVKDMRAYSPAADSRSTLSVTTARA